MEILKKEIIGNKMIILAKVTSVFYVDKANIKLTPEEIILAKNATGRVYCHLEDALNDFKRRLEIKNNY